MILGTGLAAGAQVRPDSLRQDSLRTEVVVSDSTPAQSAEQDSLMRVRILARSDSARAAYLADTLKRPVAAFEMPASGLDFDTRYRLDRDQIMSSSALDLTDLLDRVPGVTTFRSGWFAGIHAAAFDGDATRIRYFLDGVELGGIDPVGGSTVDLTSIPLWTLDELVVERGAGEIRVWMRTLAATAITPFSRVDIFTGDLNTNAFRGFVARRWRSGLMFQAGGQQVASQTGTVSAFQPGSSQSLRGDGSVQLFMARLGWASGKWSVDAYGQGGARDRDITAARDSGGFDDLPSYKGSNREAYLRIGYGDTTLGAWSQLMLQAGRIKLESELDQDEASLSSAPIPGAIMRDTVASRTQQLLAVGYRAQNWALSLTDRARLGGGSSSHAPALRASLAWRGITLGTWVERNGADSTNRREFTAMYRPASWLAFNVSQASYSPTDSMNLRLSTSALRAEGALRYKQIWFRGGVLRQAATRIPNIELLGLPGVMITAPASQGILLAADGPIYKDLRFGIQSLRWSRSQFQRPVSQMRAELALESEWRSRFPKGEFGINARLWYDMRSGTPFFYGALGGEAVDMRITEPAKVLTAHLEIRIQRGTLFYQFRNLTGGQYEQIRGITMPPATQLYGMRWEFWN